MTLPSSLPLDDLDRIHAVVSEHDWRKLQGDRLFITGGTGFVGKWMIAPLLDALDRYEIDCEITLLTRRPEAVEASSPWLARSPRIVLRSGDVRTFELPTTRIDHIIHAATDVASAGSPLEVFDTCVDGTRRIVELARKCQAKSLFHISSGAVYGVQTEGCERMDEEYLGVLDHLPARSAYAQGKRAAEFIVSRYADRGEAQVRLARCFAFLGPHLPLDGPLAGGNFIRDALARKPITVRGDGTPLRTYLHASDMSSWLWKIFFHGASGQPYNVGGADAVSMAELARLIARLSDGPLPQILGESRSGMAPDRYVPDVSRARTDLALPEPLGLEQTISRTLQWFAAR